MRLILPLSMGSLAIDSAAVQELDAEMDMGDLKIARLEGLRGGQSWNCPPEI